MVLQFLATIPFIGYILAFVFSILAVGVGLAIFEWFKLTIFRLTLLAVGIYMLLNFALPEFNEEIRKMKDVDKRRKIMIFLTILAVVLIVLGIPGLLLSAIGAPSYSVVGKI